MRFNTYKQQLLFCGTKGLARPEPRLGFWWPCCFLSVTSCLASCRSLIRTPSSHRLISHSTNFLTLRNERGQSCGELGTETELRLGEADGQLRSREEGYVCGGDRRRPKGSSENHSGSPGNCGLVWKERKIKQILTPFVFWVARQ